MSADVVRVESWSRPQTTDPSEPTKAMVAVKAASAERGETVRVSENVLRMLRGLPGTMDPDDDSQRFELPYEALVGYMLAAGFRLDPDDAL